MSACTTVGFHVPSARRATDFGPARELRVCIFRDRGLADEQLERVLSAWRAELALYRIELKTAHMLPYDRTAFGCLGMGSEMDRMDLEAPCDRAMILLKRTPTDLVWGLFLPTVFGAVDSRTGTRGYAFADLYLAENMLFFRGDEATLIHEGYHLLGCGHGLLMDECYRRIARLKRASGESQADFFPAMTEGGRILNSREEVNRVFFGRAGER